MHCINALFCLTWHRLERSDSGWQFEKWPELHRLAFRDAASSLKNVFLSVAPQWFQGVCFFNQNYWYQYKISNILRHNAKSELLKWYRKERRSLTPQKCFFFTHFSFANSCRGGRNNLTGSFQPKWEEPNNHSFFLVSNVGHFRPTFLLSYHKHI